jgi:CO/xanthine dehydrogenase Mo-binding subunit
LSVDLDGMLRIESSEVEIGCGTVELFTTIVSDQLKVDYERIRIVLGNTVTAPHGLGSFASRTAFFGGHAALDASHQFIVLCEQLAPTFGCPSDCRIADVIDSAVNAGQTKKLRVTGVYEPDNVSLPDDSGYGNTSPAYTFGVHSCCVRVDVETGLTKVIRYWAAHDSGRVLQPERARGQVIGGVVQGLGFALAEIASVDDQGRMQNPGYLDDRVATFADVVPIECIFSSTIEDEGPNGAKTIAEPPIIPVAACVANAIYHATGKRQSRLPMAPEQVWRSLHEKDSEAN